MEQCDGSDARLLRASTSAPPTVDNVLALRLLLSAILYRTNYWNHDWMATLFSVFIVECIRRVKAKQGDRDSRTG